MIQNLVSIQTLSKSNYIHSWQDLEGETFEMACHWKGGKGHCGPFFILLVEDFAEPIEVKVGRYGKECCQ